MPTFDLSPLVPAVKRKLRLISWFFLLGGVAWLILWGVTILPRYYETPESIQICVKGGCTPIPASNYFQTLNLFTGLSLLLAGSFLAAGGLLRIQRGASAVKVDPNGFSVEYPNRSARVSWEDPHLNCRLEDSHERVGAKVGSFDSPSFFSVQPGNTTEFITGEAFDAILASARVAALDIEFHRGSKSSYNDLVYTIRPRRS